MNPLMKTSESDPLRIDSVSMDGVKGQIGMTLCPGKKQEYSTRGPWDRDLDADLKAVQQFGAAALVTLMEADELADVGIPPDRLWGSALAYGLEWHRLPIQDVSTPDAYFENLWVYSGLRLRKLLSRGRNIVIHCRGGLGRTGMIAARLLVELGLPPDEAIHRVRAARAGAIETHAQENYVRKSRKIVSPEGGVGHAERFLGCLLGGAVGDAFGYGVEFMRLSEIQSRFGLMGIREPVYQKGKLVVSDDTQMTLFTLEGIQQGLKGESPSMPALVESIRQAYLDWLGTQGKNYAGPRAKASNWLAQCPELNVPRAPGTTCVSSLRDGGRGTIEKHLNESKGCGGAMRSAPAGLFRRFNPGQAFELGARSAAITHGHPSGYLSAGMVAAMIRLLLDEDGLATSTHKSCQILARWDGHQETSETIRKALELAEKNSMDHVDAIRKLGEGWVGEEAAAIALYSALAGRDYVEVIRIASNHDGDSDSTASIAGQLWGAWKGIEGIPHEWIIHLEVLAPLLRLVRLSGNE